MKKEFKAANGITFLVRIVRNGDHYGAEHCLTNTNGDLVEFYDTRHSFDYDFVGSKEEAKKAGAPVLGQFVARYYLDTLTSGGGPVNGICLHGGVKDWAIDPDTTGKIVAWLNNGAE